MKQTIKGLAEVVNESKETKALIALALDTETKDVSIAMVGSHENLLRLINKFLASDAGLSFMELTEEVVTLQELVKKIASQN